MIVFFIVGKNTKHSQVSAFKVDLLFVFIYITCFYIPYDRQLQIIPVKYLEAYYKRYTQKYTCSTSPCSLHSFFSTQQWIYLFLD